ncbi:hypothetical protein [Rhizobium sp. CC-YZS058]|uniref:hypothetical protein n=1 Tax=Rhizobium sp. CC-YZS058 TaxID=3042153 RepID=UPI002B059C7D|nr:hypothetical protein [Rhizobium sp. CC-YZS058]MEA3533726.1 hypothetical protein [Rhizobium sp. CC-YZS058]
MFKLVDNLTFWWPVKVYEPNPSKTGDTVEHVFEVEFEIISKDESRASARARRALLEEIKTDLTDVELEALQDKIDLHDLAAMRRVVRNWRKIESDAGEAIPFNDQTFAAVWAHRRVQMALVRAYDEAITLEKGRAKN